MNSTTTSQKSTLNIKLLIKVIAIFLLLMGLIYVAAPYVQEFARRTKQNTEQNSNKTRSKIRKKTKSKNNIKKNNKWENKKSNGKNEPHKNQNIKK